MVFIITGFTQRRDIKSRRDDILLTVDFNLRKNCQVISKSCNDDTLSLHCAVPVGLGRDAMHCVSTLCVTGNTGTQLSCGSIADEYAPHIFPCCPDTAVFIECDKNSSFLQHCIIFFRIIHF